MLMAFDPIDVAYEESKRAIDSQSADLDGLRTRASFILAAAGISGGTILGGVSKLTGFGLVAVMAFLLAGALAIWVLVPVVKGWTFTNDANAILRKATTSPQVDVRQWLATWNQKHYEKNQLVLEHLYRIFYAAAVSLAVAIGCTFLSLLID